MTRVWAGQVRLSASSDRHTLSLSSPVDRTNEGILVQDQPRKERSFEEAQGEAGGLRACLQHVVRTERNDSESMTLNIRGQRSILHSGVFRAIFSLLVPTASPRANIAAIKGGREEKKIVEGDPARINKLSEGDRQVLATIAVPTG